VRWGGGGVGVGAGQAASSGPWFLGGMLVIGVGMGPTSLSYILSVQHEVKWNRRGVATGAVTFLRTMGGALGVGVLGATLGYELARRLASLRGLGIEVAAALRPETHRLLAHDQLLAVQDALGRSLRDVFLQMAAMAVLATLCSLGLRGGRAVAGSTGDGGSQQVGESLEMAVGVDH